MKASEIYGSKYLSAADLNGKVIETVIEGIQVEDFQGQRKNIVPKLVLALKGCKKQLIVNRTNSERLTEKLGDDVDAWIGAHVQLGVEMTTYQGRRVPGLVIKEAALAPVKEESETHKRPKKGE